MTSIQPFDSDAYLTDVAPEIFRNAQTAIDPVYRMNGGLVTEVSSSTKQNIYTWLSQSPGFRQWHGERQVQELSGNEFTVVNEKFEETLGVDMDDLEDLSRIASIGMWIQKAGESAGQHPDIELWSFLQGLALTATHYDGVPLFSADHPLKNGSTYSNLRAGGGAPAWYMLDVNSVDKGLMWQVRKPYDLRVLNANEAGNVQGFMTEQHLIGCRARVVAAAGSPYRIYKSTEALTGDSFHSVRAEMHQYVGDSGRNIRVQPNILMVPPNLEKDALEIVQAGRNASGATNVLQGMAQIVVNPYLSATP